MAATTSSHDPVIPDELLPALHEEIARLPEKYPAGRRALRPARHPPGPGRRVAATGASGPSDVGWPRRVSGSRPGWAAGAWSADGAVLAAVLLREAGPSSRRPGERRPSGRPWTSSIRPSRAGTVSAAAQSLTHGGAQDDVRPQADDRLRRPCWRRPDGVGGLGRPGPAGRGDRQGRRPPSPSGPIPAPGPQRKPIRSTRPGPSRCAAGCSIPTASRSPAPGSTCATMPRSSGTDRPDGRAAEGPCGGRPTPTAGSISSWTRRASDGPYSSGGPVWHKAQIAAAAPGFAPAWIEAGDLVKGGEAALHLVRDDVPVRGRVLDSQGRPVAGVVVRIRAIWEVKRRGRPRRHAGLGRGG